MSGVCLGTDFILQLLSKPDVNGQIHPDSIKTVLLSNLTEPRTLGEFSTEIAVVLIPQYAPLM
jgi:hypothetical protein